MTFIAAAKQFFGFKPGQTLTDFGKEIRELTPADREEIANGLRERGYEIDAEAPKAVAA